MKCPRGKYLPLVSLLLAFACQKNPSIKPIDKDQRNVSHEPLIQTFSPDSKPNNIILVIGDGTGINQISALEFYKEGDVFYDNFPVVGLSKTSSMSLITDSAAAGTAMACGQKTFNKAIGVDTLNNPIPNVTHFMAQMGKSNGIITTSTLTHATPASFYAHHPDRNDHEIIAAFLPQSDIDFFAGPGLKYFNNRKDGANLLDTLTNNGFTIETESLKPIPQTDKIGYLLADEHMPTILEGRGPFLQDASALALSHLSKNQSGFFMMVEGSQVDWGGHDNDFDYMITELIDLDNTLGTLLSFAQKDQNTLIIVTGDHATGGLALSADQGDYNTIKPSFSSPGHNADWIPVFAYGPGAELFSGVYENNMIFHKIMSLLPVEN